MRDQDRTPVSDSAAGRRRFLQSAAWMAGAIAAGPGSFVIRPAWGQSNPIKVGIATDLTGPIGFAGNANANLAKMVANDINAKGGLLGRSLQLFVEDTASNESVAVNNVRKLIQRDRVDVVFGGITSSMRNAIKDVIVARGKTLYIYPQLYEGQECTPFIYCTGPTPAQQCDDFIPWLIKNGGKRFALPSANYVWPKLLNQYARKVIPPGVGPFIKQLYEAGFTKRGGRLSCVYYDENTLNINAAHEFEGLASCLDYFRAINDPFSAQLQAEYDKLYPGTVLFTAGSAATGMYRGIKLWEVAVKKAKKVDRETVAAALDSARIDQGPGGAAEMVPGKRHCKMNMYIAVAKNGKYEVVERSKGLVDPKEC